MVKKTTPQTRRNAGFFCWVDFLGWVVCKCRGTKCHETHRMELKSFIFPSQPSTKHVKHLYKVEEVPHQKKMYEWMDTAYVRAATVTTSKNSLEQIKFIESLAFLDTCKLLLKYTT